MSEKQRKQSTVQTEAHFQLLRAMHANPLLSQRELSKQLGISLGKTNYCVQALLEKGWIKTRHYKNNRNKIAYRYSLTSKGIKQKLILTVAFLKDKQLEFEVLSREIQQLKKETTEKQ